MKEKQIKRKSLSKKTRFEVFKRDGFKCQYCGNNPPAVTLEVDHIEPVSKGGKDDSDNLITACFDCNRGKGATSLDNIPATFSEKTSMLKEREDQLAEYSKITKAVRARVTRQVNKINKIYKSYFEGWELNERFKSSLRSNFIDKLHISEMEEAMHKACCKTNDRDDSIKYFCGICWNKINGTHP